MNKNILALYNLLMSSLFEGAPELSGNLKNHLFKVSKVDEHSITIVIEAPFYDINLYNKTKEIIFTGPWKKDPTITDYAMWLNDYGAFHTFNKSQYWTNRVITQTCKAFAESKGGEVTKNDLPL